MAVTCLQPLGDQAALVYLADENAALRFTAAVRSANEGWLIDVVQAYTSVAVFFDPDRTHYVNVAEHLRGLEAKMGASEPPAPDRSHQIPCCYEFQLDLKRVARQTKLPEDEIIRLHGGV